MTRQKCLPLEVPTIPQSSYPQTNATFPTATTALYQRAMTTTAIFPMKKTTCPPCLQAVLLQWLLHRLQNADHQSTKPSVRLSSVAIPKRSHLFRSHQRETSSPSATTSALAAGEKTARAQNTFAGLVKVAASAGPAAGQMCLKAGTRATTSNVCSSFFFFLDWTRLRF